MHVALTLHQAYKPVAVAIGNFDGLHRGHQQVLQPVLSSTIAIRTVLTFYPHPQEVLSGQPRLLLTPPQEKQELLQHLGIEQLVQLPFTEDLAIQPPHQFIATVLEQGLQVQQLSVGWDFCFGHQRSGNARTLADWGHKQGIRVDIIPEIQLQGERVSSSRIRAALDQGEVSMANLLLGRGYCLQGTVVRGDQRGRQLGFPTANLQLPAEKYLPRDGVYSVWVHHPQHAQPLAGVMNVGLRPTVSGVQRTVEVHVLDWQGDLYGLCLAAELVSFLRPEQRFESLEALKAQIQQDCQTARQQLYSSRGFRTPTPVG